MKIIRQSSRYTPDIIVERYVRVLAVGVLYRVAEVAKDKYTYREWDGHDEIPADIRAMADQRVGYAFGSVEWPL